MYLETCICVFVHVGCTSRAWQAGVLQTSKLAQTGHALWGGENCSFLPFYWSMGRDMESLSSRDLESVSR